MSRDQLALSLNLGIFRTVKVDVDIDVGVQPCDKETHNDDATIVCYTAVFSVVTQRSSPLTAAENRTTFLSF